MASDHAFEDGVNGDDPKHVIERTQRPCIDQVESYSFQAVIDPAGTSHIIVAAGSFTVHEGTAEEAMTTIITKGDDYIAMVKGDLNGKIAFMTGKMQILRAIPMAMKLKPIVPLNQPKARFRRPQGS